MNALVAAALWIVAAGIAQAIPSKRNHWPAAWGLIVAGLPILAWVWLTAHWAVAALVTLAFASVLRWPIRYGLKALGRRS